MNTTFIKASILTMLVAFTSFLQAQIEEIEPVLQIETTESNTEVSDQDYKDTWRTPFVTDDMTVDPEQNMKWRQGEYKYNSQPKSSWEVGLHGGHFFIDGDVDRTIPGGWGAGLHLRKAINYIFSLRGSLFYGQATGLENQFWRHRNNGGGLVEDTFDPIDPLRGGPGEWIPSHRTRYIAGDLAVVFNIGNLLFHKERNKWNWYAALGLGLDNHEVKLDLLDSDGTPYTNVRAQIGWTQELFDTRAGRDQIESQINQLYDGVYETEGFKKQGIFRIGDDVNIHPIFVPSMGISRKITKRINVGLEHQVYLSDNDYLDGIKFRTAVDQTNNLDIGHYTHLRIGVNIGNFEKVTEPLYWLNPYDAAFNDIADLKSQPALDLTDEDNDGVLDIIDQELDTPEDCPVDTRGVLLDSDGDGIVDCQDKEPYSRPGCPIDEVGVAQCEEECCATEESINELIDARAEEIERVMSQNGIAPVETRTEVRTKTRTVTDDDGTIRTETYQEEVEVPVRSTNNVRNGAGGTTVARSGCGEWFLPMIHFDLNKSSIKPEYFSHLHNVAQVLNKCPEVCVVAQGHTDQRNSNDYNTVLSYKRSKSAVDYLVDNYGIDRSRIKLMYGGEENPMIASPNSEAHHFMNRRVEFRTCEAKDFDMAAPDGYNEVGSGSGYAPTQKEYYNGNKSSGY
jgi:outer membrane protein OmpA-like peptidoglycan-associated protein